MDSTQRPQTVDSEETGLLPCPFCGNTDLEEKETRPCSVICPKCGGQLHSGMNLDLAKERWNWRAPMGQTDDTKRLDWLEKRMTWVSHQCCGETLGGEYWPWQTGRKTFREVIDAAASLEQKEKDL